jgi:hypothetical protein
MKTVSSGEGSACFMSEAASCLLAFPVVWSLCSLSLRALCREEEAEKWAEEQCRPRIPIGNVTKFRNWPQKNSINTASHRFMALRANWEADYKRHVALFQSQIRASSWLASQWRLSMGFVHGLESTQNQ